MIAILLLACGGAETLPTAPEPVVAEAPKPAEPSDVDRAVAVARAIDADPTKADEALAAQGLTEAEYRELLFVIAADAAKAEAFASKR